MTDGLSEAQAKACQNLARAISDAAHYGLDEQGLAFEIAKFLQVVLKIQ